MEDGRVFKCTNYGLIYDRDLNACINIAHRVMSSMGWRNCEPVKPVNESGKGKLQANTGSPSDREG